MTRLTIRARLTALYAALLAGSTAILLGLSWWLMDRHLHRTLPERLADDSAETLAVQYLLAFAGTTAIAVALGWLIAGRVLAPIKRMTEVAHSVTDERLDERVAQEGPRDELRELGETLDAMLARLRSSLEAQRRFVANASHELRSPLTVIRTETEVTLADPDASPDDFRAMARVVLEATDRTEALLDGLMVLARSQRGLLRTAPVDLCTVSRRAAAGGMAAARAAGVRIEVEADGSATVDADEPLLERLVANLVDNAVRYNEPGGWVVVRAGGQHGDAAVEVENSGPHVPAEAVDRLTQPFERLDRARESRGTGLGLSIVRAVAEAHGARLGIAARHDGGLRVRVTFAHP
ncbi:MAG TPA: HAMP domain-containing sensor histidine kinase [Solirubrobacteraceae bacterium]|nr:HAMP domain-containing sensor histidine kinase [Solirubrobacteraceae bacterium]